MQIGHIEPERVAEDRGEWLLAKSQKNGDSFSLSTSSGGKILSLLICFTFSAAKIDLAMPADLSAILDALKCIKWHSVHCDTHVYQGRERTN